MRTDAPSRRAPGRKRPAARPADKCRGLTLVELLLALAVAALLMAGIAGVIGRGLEARSSTQAHHDRVREARFAMERLRRAVGRSQRLVLPLPDNPTTAWSEAVRDVLAVTLDPGRDSDGDGFADADNDRDGRVDEDPGDDMNNDGAAGILGIDDDGDGQIDESSPEDDDEDEDGVGTKDEETLGGLDADGDGALEEDLAADLNQDGEAGVAGLDDDEDGQVDESNQDDDDEDEDDRGTRDEDWFDTVVYFVQGGELIERLPNPHATNGLAFSEQTVATNVSQFRVERVPPGANDRALLIDLTLRVAAPGGGETILQGRVRLGGEL